MPETDPDAQDQHDEDVVTDDGPDVAELDSDPAYNPQDEDLKDLKGG
jgi:hypothetical protein